MTSTMDIARREASARVQARRRPPADRVIGINAQGSVTATEVQGSEFLPPQTLAEWCDDALLMFGQYRGPFSEVTASVLEAARTGGTDAACHALRAARTLTKADQFRLVSGDLTQLQNRIGDRSADVPEARQLMNALDREASRLRLATSPPPFAEAELDKYLTDPDLREKPRPGSERLAPVPAGLAFDRSHGLA